MSLSVTELHVPPPSCPDAALLALRPTIAIASATGNATPANFLRYTLWPLLKLQNETILAVVADFMLAHHADKQRQLTELMTCNLKLRYISIGVVSDLLTTAERSYHRQHCAHLNRRLLELSLRQVQCQVGTVVNASVA
ncbi:hypothetical protein [Hymenobacter norwichensis]|uniref:hypothetical protein n=1 Tax=Hymenobacter norwichensis TaxID=223903 RepID=UPI0003B50216|nr:hypothetical protein [Hymenobacter norwichensis]